MDVSIKAIGFFAIARSWGSWCMAERNDDRRSLNESQKAAVDSADNMVYIWFIYGLYMVYNGGYSKIDGLYMFNIMNL